MKNKNLHNKIYDNAALEDPLFLLYGGFENLEFQEQIKTNSSLVKKFCQENNLELIEIGATQENGYFEPAYIFNDKIKFHYTIEGIERSLIRNEIRYRLN